MKVLLLSPLPPPSGGIASWTIRYQEYCALHNIDLRIINTAMLGKRATKETMKKNLWNEIKRTYQILHNTKKELLNNMPDIVHINTSCQKFGVVRDAICVALAHRKVPIIVHCRCNIEDQLNGKLAKKAFAYMCKKSRKTIVLNGFSRKYVDDICKEKAIIIPNFIDEKMIDCCHEIRSEINEIVIVGHVERAKGLEIINQAATQNPSIHFLFVGAIREDISSIKISQNVSFAGRVDVEKVKEYLRRADIFVLASNSEGFSNAVLEAMAMGLPIVATDVGANREMIENEGGYIMKSRSPEEVTNGISFLSSANRRKKASQWNVNKVQNSYIADIIMKKYIELYK